MSYFPLLENDTIRRYMNYLENSGKVIGQMNYETGGRPCMVYCLEE